MSEEHRNEPYFFSPLWNTKPQTLRSLLSRVYTRLFKYRNYNLVIAISNLLSCENTQSYTYRKTNCMSTWKWSCQSYTYRKTNCMSTWKWSCQSYTYRKTNCMSTWKWSCQSYTYRKTNCMSTWKWSCQSYTYRKTNCMSTWKWSCQSYTYRKTNCMSTWKWSGHPLVNCNYKSETICLTLSDL